VGREKGKRRRGERRPEGATKLSILSILAYNHTGIEERDLLWQLREEYDIYEKRGVTELLVDLENEGLLKIKRPSGKPNFLKLKDDIPAFKKMVEYLVGVGIEEDKNIPVTYAGSGEQAQIMPAEAFITLEEKFIKSPYVSYCLNKFFRKKVGEIAKELKEDKDIQISTAYQQVSNKVVASLGLEDLKNTGIDAEVLKRVVSWCMRRLVMDEAESQLEYNTEADVFSCIENLFESEQELGGLIKESIIYAIKYLASNC